MSAHITIPVWWFAVLFILSSVGGVFIFQTLAAAAWDWWDSPARAHRRRAAALRKGKRLPK